MAQTHGSQDYSCVITNTERLFAAGNNDGQLLRDEAGEVCEAAAPQYSSFDEPLFCMGFGSDEPSKRAEEPFGAPKCQRGD